jgi:hypothetical protein
MCMHVHACVPLDCMHCRLLVLNVCRTQHALFAAQSSTRRLHPPLFHPVCLAGYVTDVQIALLAMDASTLTAQSSAQPVIHALSGHMPLALGLQPGHASAATLASPPAPIRQLSATVSFVGAQFIRPLVGTTGSIYHLHFKLSSLLGHMWREQ